MWFLPGRGGLHSSGGGGFLWGFLQLADPLLVWEAGKGRQAAFKTRTTKTACIPSSTPRETVEAVAMDSHQAGQRGPSTQGREPGCATPLTPLCPSVGTAVLSLHLPD